jgi:hypothetical protein
MECGICLDICRIPVQPTCFSCFDNDKMHCFSYQRFCLECFLQYIENKSNCPYCHKSINTQNDWYHFEKRDRQENITCPICHGEDIDDWKSHSEGCFIICDCGDTIKKEKEEEYHCKICPKFELCILCGKYILERNKAEHIKDHKERGTMMCPLCEEQVSIRNFMQLHWIPHIEYYREKHRDVQKILEHHSRLLSNMIKLTVGMYNKIYRDNLFEEESSLQETILP